MVTKQCLMKNVSCNSTGTLRWCAANFELIYLLTILHRLLCVFHHTVCGGQGGCHGRLQGCHNTVAGELNLKIEKKH